MKKNDHQTSEKTANEKTVINGEAPKENIVSRIRKSQHFVPVSVIILLICLAGIALSYQITNSTVYVEKSQLYAPITSLVPEHPGILEKVYVKEGDIIGKSKVIAIIGNQSIYSQTQGVVVDVVDTPGQYFSTQTPVVKIIENDQLVVIGRVQENKGLKDVKPGQKVVFKVDAFGSKKYYGTVDTISPTSRQSDIVFSISDKREQQEFNVKVKFDIDAYPELKNGMSAKMWIYK